MRTSQYRYTEWVEFDKNNWQPFWDISHGRELYDHNIDPEENYNIVDKNAELVENLSAKLHGGWRYVIMQSC